MAISRQQRRAAERKGFAAGAALALGAVLAPEVAHAATFTVTNTNDSGAGSLRDAVAQANAAGGADTIDFSVTGTITLTSGELDITESVTIDGPGRHDLAISGNDNSRIFNVDDGSPGTLQNVTIQDVTLTDGFLPGLGSQGGAILSHENLTILDAEITGNIAWQAGGIHHTLGSFTIESSSISSNTGVLGRGGIDVYAATNVSLSNVTIANNEASSFGGAYLVNIGTLAIENSRIVDNEANSFAGIGIWDGSQTNPALIHKSTISGNSATQWGGGIHVRGTTLTIENSTISGNVAGTGEGNYGRGGGLYARTSPITLRHSTVVNNTADDAGGNIMLYDPTVSLTIESSIVANGIAPVGSDFLINDGGTVTANYSLIEIPPVGMTGANNIVAVDPQLGPLQDNGGFTQTHLPAGTSPVIDAGDPAPTSPPSTDQRGGPRIANGTIDMGSVEVTSILSLSSTTYTVGEGGGTLTITVNRTGGSAGAVSANYQVSNGTALSGADFPSVPSGTLHWEDSDTAPKSFDITITDDDVFESSETIDITLSAPGGGATIGTSAAVATITDNDSQPTISIGNASQLEGNSGTTTIAIPVTLSNPSVQAITVNYTTADDSADEPADYTAASGTATFDPETSTTSILVFINGDADSESDEDFTITLSSPSNATIADGTGTGTILNDEVAPIVVSNTNDSGAGSLREAVTSANTTPGVDKITFAVTGTITLTTGQLAVTENLTVDGPGSSSLTISGNDNSRIFEINDGNDNVPQSVSIDGITFTQGAAPAMEGGAILSRENLTLTDVVLTDNAAGAGGALNQHVGSISISNSSVSLNSTTTHGAGVVIQDVPFATLANVPFTNNTASGEVGGVELRRVGTVLIEDCVFSNNDSEYGSGLFLQRASEDTTATIRDTTISGNTSTVSSAGIEIQETGVHIERSTISGNTTGGWGGGIYAKGTSLTIDSSTISGNVSGTDPESDYPGGGGLYLYAGSTATLRNTTVAGNSSEVRAGNIRVRDSILTLENSIVANGSAPVGPDIQTHGTGTVTANYSLIETPPESLGGANNITGVDPELGPLQNNGGPTATHRPDFESPAIDAGDPSFVAPPSTDQRGFSRVVHGAIDIGAVEVQNVLSFSSATYSVNENGGTLNVTVNRTGSVGAISVDYDLDNGTAVANSDYAAPSGTLEWEDGDTAPKSIEIEIVNDNLYEGSETFSVMLESPEGDVIVDGLSAVVTITDNESQPAISIGNVTQNEGNSGTTSFTFNVTLSGPSVQTITANYATANGTALAGSDYTAASSTVTFNPEDTSEDIVISVNGDTAVETDETFTVTLTSPTNATIASGTGTGTIDADDTTTQPPTLFSATAASTSQVNLSWAPVTGATSYEIFRATSVSGGYSLLMTTSNTTHADLAVSANTTYLYKVRVTGGVTFSSVDVATTVSFTDPVLSSAIPIKAAHITQLRTAVNAMRAAAGLSAATFTDSTLTPQSTIIKRVHLAELRTALDAARSAMGLSALSYTDPTITVQSTPVKAAHITELRSGV